MLVATETSVDLTARERPSLAALALRNPVQRHLDPADRLRIEEHLPPSLKHRLLDEIGDSVQIIKGIEGQLVIAPFKVTGWSATVLRRTGATAVKAQFLASAARSGSDRSSIRISWRQTAFRSYS